MSEVPAVTMDWARDFDVLDSRYLEDPTEIWRELRKTCGIAHTVRRGSTWLATTYDDVTAMAHDVAGFSSTDINVIPPATSMLELLPFGAPPITVDPPMHTWTRRILLPWFSHARVASYEMQTRDMCASLIDGFIADGHADAAADYAQHIPVRVIAQILGVPLDMSDTFTEWVRDMVQVGDDLDRQTAAGAAAATLLVEQMEIRKSQPSDDLLTALAQAEFEGEPVEFGVRLGIAMITLIAGVDTTWSAIGASLWHFATHEEDRERMISEPDLMTLAIEELLRAYSPVTMARVVTEDIVYKSCPMKVGDRVLLSFPAANRDDRVFNRPDEVILDREENRHVAFGSGIHRCAGSNLARMELRVALEEWFRRIPEFHLANEPPVHWSGGQIRGPRTVPVNF